MADLLKTNKPGPQSYAPTVCVQNVANNADQEFAWMDGDELIAFNSGGSERTITVYAVADPSGRTRNTTYAIAAGAIVRFGELRPKLNRQANGKLKVKATHADVKFVLLSRTPAEA